MSKSIKLKNDTYIDLSALLHPVGEIYTTTNAEFNPNNEWYGTWERLEDRFLIGAGGKFNNGETGGQITDQKELIGTAIGGYTYTNTNIIAFKNSNYSTRTPNSNVNNGRNGSGAGSYSSQPATGRTQVYCDMPSYLAVYMWHRVS